MEDFESRPHKAVSFEVERNKEVQGWNEQKMPEVLLGYSGGRLPGRSTKERGREEEDAEEEGRERHVRKEIVQEVVAGLEKKARAQIDAKPTAQRFVGQSVKQNWVTTAKEELTVAEALCWNGGVREKKTGSTEYESGEKIVGQGFSPCSRKTTCTV